MIELWGGHDEGADDAGRRSLLNTGRGGERAGARVLVVDDDPSILDTVSAILMGEGYSVMAAGGGEEALALVRSWHPTLVLLDMRMPVMDGWAVARSLHEAGLRVPIIVMTAAESARRWADEIGAAGHLAKPFALDELIDCVEKYTTRDGRQN
jgi:two-component system, chemotaxis family, chemotaxis protein CheY